MNPLRDLLRSQIRERGPIPVSEYMEQALAHPDYGYYRNRDPLGRAGDFITAPEISQVFGELIGLWCAIAWQQAGQPNSLHLVELGPGRGTMMMDMLRAAKSVPGFAEALTIDLIETSPVLKKRQQETLEDTHPETTITWHDDMTSMTDGPVIIIANEFFDALPIEQWIKTAEGWRKRCVDLDPEHNFVFVADDRDAAPDGTVPESVDENAAISDIFETCPAGVAVAADIATRIARDGAAALIIDYGHPHSAPGDTLQALGGHQRKDVLDQPGDFDITAHVDFEALSKRMAFPGLSMAGPIPQGAFLTALGIETRTAMLAAKGTEKQATKLNDATRRLIAADAMGTLFKVMAVGRADLAPLPGLPAAQQETDDPMKTTL